MYVTEEAFRQAVQVMLARRYRESGGRHDIDSLVAELKEVMEQRATTTENRRPLLKSRA